MKAHLWSCALISCLASTHIHFPQATILPLPFVFPPDVLRPFNNTYSPRPLRLETSAAFSLFLIFYFFCTGSDFIWHPAGSSVLRICTHFFLIVVISVYICHSHNTVGPWYADQGVLFTSYSLAQCLTHSRCSFSICWMIEKILPQERDRLKIIVWNH